MKSIGRFICVGLLSFCVTQVAYAQVSLDIALKEGTKGEAQTKEQLQRILKTYDISPWIYTKSILIDEKSIPHSHPVLTLHTRHLLDDELLLSSLVHEQFHWFFLQNDQQTRQAINELRKLIPKVPAGAPEGAIDENSTYLHLLVCYLEYRADRTLLGELKARQVMEFWATDHYTWVYKTVLERSQDIGNLMLMHKLIPPGR